MLPDRFYSTIMRLGLDKTASAAASVSCGQGNFKWLAGPPGFQRERAAHQGIEAAVAQDPNGLACPGTGPEAPRALTSVLRSAGASVPLIAIVTVRDAANAGVSHFAEADLG